MPELHYSIFQKKNEVNFKLEIITKTMKITLIRNSIDIKSKIKGANFIKKLELFQYFSMTGPVGQLSCMLLFKNQALFIDLLPWKGSSYFINSVVLYLFEL